VIKLLPPLTISDHELARGLDGLERAVSRVLEAENSDPRRQTSQLAAAE
jgi:acetylornithine/succinyldiaminopimelate/putrescine aminotransferase